MELIKHLFTQYFTLFFLLTPFFVLGTFISLTDGKDDMLRRRLAYKVTLWAILVTLLIFFLGEYIMRMFGITVDAFRAGSGVLLLLSAISLVYNKENEHKDIRSDKLLEMAVVPLAVPITAGPATLGALMVMGSAPESLMMKLITAVSIIMACASVGVLLGISNTIDRLMGHSNVTIFSKVTGLILSAIALQMITTGVKNLWMMP